MTTPVSVVLALLVKTVALILMTVVQTHAKTMEPVKTELEDLIVHVPTFLLEEHAKHSHLVHWKITPAAPMVFAFNQATKRLVTVLVGIPAYFVKQKLISV